MTSAQDFLVAKFALKANLLSTDTLQPLLEEQRERGERGQPPPLVQLLVQRRVLTREQLVSVMRSVEGTTFDCERCCAHFPYSAIGSNGPLACPRCRGALKILKADGEAVSERLITGRRANGPTRPALPALLPETRPDTSPRADSSSQRLTKRERERDSDRNPVPRTFGPYEIIDELGRGGMGVVYKAHHPALDRVVALKVLLAGNMASKTQIKRFQREAELAGKLKHPGIVPIHDIGVIDERHFFTMDFVEGDSLETLVKNRDLPVRQAVEIVRDIARALGHAHNHGVVHRDVKPANVIVDAERRPHIMDFGLAKDLEGESPRLTREGAAVGTPFYMSPEQAKGDRNAVGPASDIYSLGVVFFELLTFDLPFKASTQAELTKKILLEPPPRPSAIEPTIELDIELVCLKALEKDAQARYHSADELADDLDRWLRGEPVMARPKGLANRVRTGLRQKRTALVQVGIVLAAIAAAGVGVTLIVVKLQKLEEQRIEAEKKRQKELKEAKDAEVKRLAELLAKQRREAAQKALDEAALVWSEVERVPITTAPDTFFEKLNRVIALAGDAITNDPESARAYLVRGKARDIGRQTDVAAADLRKAAELDPSGVVGAEAAYRAVRITIRHQHDMAVANKELEAITQRTDGGVWRLVAKASALLLDTPPRLEEARAVIDEASNLDQTCPEVYYVRALATGADDKTGAHAKEALTAINACLDADRKNARAYAFRARVQLATNHADLAMEDLRVALVLDPDDVLALLARAEVYSMQGRMADAIVDLKHVVKTIEPHEDPDILLHLATLLARSRQMDEARSYAERAIERAPDSEQAYLLVARFLAEQDLFELAVQKLRAGITHCASRHAAVDELLHTGVGMLLRARRPDEAEAFAKWVATQFPGDNSIKLSLAEFYGIRLTGKDDETAIGLLEELHASAPTFIEAWKTHAHLLLILKRPDEADALMKRLLRIAPESAGAWLLASTVFEFRDLRAAAKEAAQKASTLDPKSPAVLVRLSQIAVNEGDLRGSETYARAALEADPANIDALTVLGMLAANQKRDQEAIGYLSRVLERDPREPNAAYFMAMTLLNEDRWDAAAQVAERAIGGSVEPSPKLLEALGLAQISQNKLDEAERTLNASLAGDRNSVNVHLGLGQIYLKRHQPNLAVIEAQRALAIEPDNKAAKRLLTQAQGEAPPKNP